MSMRTIRQPAVAGRFYPGRAHELRASVDGLLDSARAATGSILERPKALIVPHAGYIYSGPTAARGYVLLEPFAASISTVVLVGPAHHVGFRGLALSDADAFATPLGEVPVDRTATPGLCTLPAVIHSDAAHAPEHSLEVQLPFLQTGLADFAVVPLLVGDADPESVASALEEAWGGPETLLLISSDLSHYLPYDQARVTDADTIRRILALAWPLPDGSACGARGINGMLLAARDHDLTPTLIDARNSGDTAGDRARVVGYASVSFTTFTGIPTGGDHDD